MIKYTFLIILNTFICFGSFAQELINKDVVVYGGTASGVMAAIAAAREGVIQEEKTKRRLFSRKMVENGMNWAGIHLIAVIS